MLPFLLGYSETEDHLGLVTKTAYFEEGENMTLTQKEFESSQENLTGKCVHQSPIQHILRKGRT